MSETVLEKQDKRLYADDTMPLCATIVQYRSVGSHVVRASLRLRFFSYISSLSLHDCRSTRYGYTNCSAPIMSGQ